ncbi:hypothetical protein FRC17_010205 [Serendipita sp. 399]|nr:hypothetical protein FRC17_010205 [Serendipita sp. 399]
MATPLWRKDDEGNTLCNALKLHGTRRPLSMKSDVIRKRSRHETEKRTSVSSIITVMNPGNTNTQNSRRNSPTPPPSAGSSSSGPEPLVNGQNGIDSLGFPFEQEFSYGNEPDYLSSIGLGMGNDLNAFSTFGSYVFYGDNNSSSSNLTNRNGLASPRSPTEVQHIVETTVMTGVENGGGHVAPNAKRRRMTIESSFSGSSMAQTTGGANSAHSSPTGLAQKGPNTSPPFFSLDATLNNVNNSSNGSYTEPSGNASPTRSAPANASSPTQSMTGITYDYYGYPIHPPMVPLHPPSLMHPHSMMWGDNNTPTQSSMHHRRARSQSHSHSPTHSRTSSNTHSHSRSNSQHITMPLYLYDGGASSRAYEGGNAMTPTGMMTSGSTGNPAEDELFMTPFGIYTDHPSMEETRMHYGPPGM